MGFWTRLKNNITQAFWWHGLLCASNPFRVIVATILIAAILSWPTLSLLLSFRHRPNVDIWHPPTAIPSSSGVHLDVPPSWYKGQCPSLELQQIILSVPHDHDVRATQVIDAVRAVTKAVEAAQVAVRGEMVSVASLCQQLKASTDQPCTLVSPSLFSTKDDATNILAGVDADASLHFGNATLRPAHVLSSVPQPSYGSRPLSRLSWVVTLPLIRGCDESIREKKEALMRHIKDQVLPSISNIDVHDVLGSQTFVYYTTTFGDRLETLLFALAYLVVFVFFWFGSADFPTVKSKVGLALSVVSMVTSSVCIGIGVCRVLGVLPEISGTVLRVVPLLVIAVGLENMITITRSVGTTPSDKAVRFRVAEGLARVAYPLSKSLFQQELLLFIGILSGINVLRQFCLVASAAVVCDFALQVVLYVAVVALDTRRLELSDAALPSASKISSPISPLGSKPQSLLSRLPFSGRLSKAAPAADNKSLWDQRFSTPKLARATVKEVTRRGTNRNIIMNNVIVMVFMIAIIVLVFIGRSGRIHHVAARPQPVLDADWSGLLPGNDVHEFISFRPVVLAIFDDPVVANQHSKAWHALHNYFLLGAQQHMVTFEVWTGALFVTAVTILAVVIVSVVKKQMYGPRTNADSLAALSLLESNVHTLPGHASDIEAMSVCQTTGRVATTCLSGIVRVWDIHHRTIVAVLRTRPAGSEPHSLPAPTIIHTSSAQARRGSHVWSSDDAARVIGSRGRSSTQTSIDEVDAVQGSERGLAPQGTASHTSTSSDTEADAANAGDRFWRLASTFSPVWALDISEDLVAVGCQDGTVEVWQTAQHVRNLLIDDDAADNEPRQPASITAVHLDGKNLFYTTATGFVQHWTIEFSATQRTMPMSPSLRHHFPPHSPRTHHRGSSMDASTVQRDWFEEGGFAYLNVPQCQPYHVEDGTMTSGAATGPWLSAPPGVDESLTRSDSCPTMANTGKYDYARLQCTRAAIKRCHQGAISHLLGLHNVLVTGGEDKILRVLDKATLHCRNTLYGHQAPISVLARPIHEPEDLPSGDTVVSDRLPRDERTMASGDSSGVVAIWDILEGRRLATLEGHADSILQIQMNREYVVSSAEDDTIRIWRRDRHTCVRVLRLYQACAAMALHCSSILLTAGEGNVTAFDLLANAERLRTITLTSAEQPWLSKLSQHLMTSHIVLFHDTVVCCMGSLVKLVRLPFPQLRYLKRKYQ